MHRHEQLAEPLLTPTTKAEMGAHDELTSREELIASGAISEQRYDEAAALAASLFARGQEFAASRGLILVDTKYEMGIDDEVLKAGLAGFSGVKRRFTKTGEAGGITVIDDYAHHPVEIAAVLQAARQATIAIEDL